MSEGLNLSELIVLLLKKLEMAGHQKNPVAILLPV